MSRAAHPDGLQVLLTSVFSGADGSWMFTVGETDESDPWNIIVGDVTGDGAVTQADIERIIANLGAEGPHLTQRAS